MSARATVTSGPGEGMDELSAPYSPWECDHRWGDGGRSTLSHPNSCNGRGGPGQKTPVHSLPIECGVKGTGSWGSDQSKCGSNPRGRVYLDAETHNLSSVLDVRGGAPWLGIALPQCWL